MRKLLIILPVAFGLSACETAELESSRPIADPGSIQRVKESLAYSLKDPSSALFRGEYVAAITASKEDQTASGKIVCIQMNGKNSFGAYAGYKLYAVLINEKGEISPAVREDFAVAPCRQAGYAYKV